jgi:hypothetical protein
MAEVSQIEEVKTKSTTEARRHGEKHCRGQRSNCGGEEPMAEVRLSQFDLQECSILHTVTPVTESRVIGYIRFMPSRPFLLLRERARWVIH